MGRRRELMPRLIERVSQIWKITGKKPTENPKKLVGGLCDKCDNRVKVVKLDHGPKPKLVERKRGRPKKGNSKILKRYEHIGWWCSKCNIFYYLDGSPDYRGIT